MIVIPLPSTSSSCVPDKVLGLFSTRRNFLLFKDQLAESEKRNYHFVWETGFISNKDERRSTKHAYYNSMRTCFEPNLLYLDMI